MFKSIEQNPNATFTVSLEDQTIRNDSTGATFSFDINAYKKMCLLNGYDDIDFLLSLKDKIAAFEKQQVIY